MDPIIIKTYEQVLQPKFIAILRSVQKLDWASFVLNINGGQYVLDVVTRSPKNPSWRKASAALESKFKDVTKKNLRVNITKVQMFEEVRSVAPGTEQPYTRGDKNPFGLYSLGRSIGVEELDYPGTLGGFITVTTGGKPRVYGLTNNHVVNVGRTTNTPPENPTYVEVGNTIYCPNSQDLEATKRAKRYNDILSVKIGQVKAASGRTLAMPPGAVYPCLLDWAIIDLNSQTLQKMRSDDRKLKSNYQLHQPQRPTPPFPASPISYDPRVHLVPGMTVYKWGRTTSVTSGDVKDVRSVLNLSEVEGWHGSIHNPHRATEVAELVVGPTGISRVPFCEPGDSGSLVVDEAGHVVGLLWARVNQDTVVTDIRVVFEAIRAKLKLGQGAVFDVSSKI